MIRKPKYIVLDLEWNQPLAGSPPEYCPFPLSGEIIEIGAVKLDKNFKPAEQYKAYIKPVFYTTMQPFVRRLTGITDRKLSGAHTFPVEIKKFFKWCGSNFTFITWGCDDLPILCDNFLAHEMSTSQIPASYNLQSIYTSQKETESNQISLSSVCEELGIIDNLPEHDALYDAYHTALICGHLDMKSGIKNYIYETRPLRHYEHPEKEKAVASLFEDRVCRDVKITGFESRRQALYDDRIAIVPCPVCSLPMNYDYFVSQSDDRKIAKCSCRDHGRYFARIKIREEDDSTLTVTRSLHKYTKPINAYYMKLDKLGRVRKK